MKTINEFKNIYFLGIGGIGMSALARYFKQRNYKVAGYDKTHSPLTELLINEGISIHYEDLGDSIPQEYCNKEETLIVLTPAIPKDLKEWAFFKKNEFTILKRAEVLGLITNTSRGIGVAGTHGKTTTSSMLTHVLSQSSIKCSAFLGGISSNLNSNFISSTATDITVVEADEFDRSFLQLFPFAGIITSTDADHLDIYGDASHFLEGFQLYANQINEKGLLVLKKGLEIRSKAPIITYAINEDADIKGFNLSIENGKFLMDVKTHSATWLKVELGLPGIHNAENALACIGLALFLGLNELEVRNGLRTFLGVKRRFEYQIRKENLIYIDDYAHHPTEIHALISSIKLIYPNKKIIGAFQPHLFSRTRDFMDNFAMELSALDELILLPIYPARELPIEGITSEVLLEKCTNKAKQILTASASVAYLSTIKEGVVLTIGAGDIDRIVPLLKENLGLKNK